MSPAGPDDVYVNYPDYRNEDGIVGPLPASDGQGQIPEAGFFTGPEIGDRLAEFGLPALTTSKPSVDGTSLYIGYGLGTGGVRAYILP